MEKLTKICLTTAMFGIIFLSIISYTTEPQEFSLQKQDQEQDFKINGKVLALKEGSKNQIIISHNLTVDLFGSIESIKTGDSVEIIASNQIWNGKPQLTAQIIKKG